ncbi:MAG TPA: T9SS type A sorting domain-containing protein [Flavobacteriales bacterium]|nr:T9SS type A sorting domain-containing protein [Flavobacteriales bacterium]
MDANGQFQNVFAYGAGFFNDQGFTLELDAQENIYARGFFGGQVDFDPGPGTTTLDGGTNGSPYVAKLTPAGALQWVSKTLGLGGAIRIGPAQEIIAGGDFTGTAVFGPEAGQTATSNGSMDVFVLKYLQVQSGVAELPSAPALLCYPVPVQDRLTLRLPGTPARGMVRVLASDGRVVLQQRMTTELYMGGLPAGLYVVRVEEEGGRAYQARLVKE